MGNTQSLDEINLALHEAAENGDLADVKKYLQKGGDINKLILRNGSSKAKGKDKPKTVTDKASDSAKPNEPKLTEEENDEIAHSKLTRRKSRKKKVRMNALHRATTRKNNVAVMDFIVKRIVNIDEQDSNGDTSLHYAAMYHNNIEPVTLLLKSRPNVDLQNDHGETALHTAVKYGCDLKIIEQLLKEGANPNIADSEGDTPLHSCALRRGVDPLIPGIILRFGGNPNLKNKHGQTALHAAAEACNNAVLLLLKFNAKVRLRDNNGNRPSEVANSEEIRKILMEEENDLLERTTRTSDIVEAVEVNTFNRSRPQSARSINSWLNDQESNRNFDDESEKMMRARQERESKTRVLYPRQSVKSDIYNDYGRLSQWESDVFSGLSGSGGMGTLVLPGNKEIVIPPDAVPMGTRLKVIIKPNSPSVKIPDFDNFDFEFDLNIQLPGTSFLSSWMNDIRNRNPSLVIQPAFSGMCMEGSTSWQCVRELTDEPGSDVRLSFSMKKENCVPLVKRVSVTNGVPGITRDAQILSSEKGNGNDEGNISDDTDSDEIFRNGASSEGNFWARQVLVVKEASETSGSCDESENDSYLEAEENLINEQQLDEDDMPINYGDSVLEMEDNPRIQHPIDSELATITEEDTNAFQIALHKEEKKEAKDYSDTNAMILEGQLSPSELKESTPSLDSGYRGSLEIEE